VTIVIGFHFGASVDLAGDHQATTEMMPPSASMM
jgi:hypothetical protein